MSDNIDLDGQFKEIVSNFETTGIIDSMLIAEHIAFFALCWHGGTWDSLISEVYGTAREMSEDFMFLIYRICCQSIFSNQMLGKPIPSSEQIHGLSNQVHRQGCRLANWGN